MIAAGIAPTTEKRRSMRVMNSVPRYPETNTIEPMMFAGWVNRHQLDVIDYLQD
jgi:hypothetical protein